MKSAMNALKSSAWNAVGFIIDRGLSDALMVEDWDPVSKSSDYNNITVLSLGERII